MSGAGVAGPLLLGVALRVLEDCLRLDRHQTQEAVGLSLALGVLLGMAYVWRATRQTDELRVHASTIHALPLVYLGFALYIGAVGLVYVELLGLFLWGSLGGLAGHALSDPEQTRPMLVIARIMTCAAWFLHPLWDFMHFEVDKLVGSAPRWYALVCMSFDWVVFVRVLMLPLSTLPPTKKSS